MIKAFLFCFVEVLVFKHVAEFRKAAISFSISVCVSLLLSVCVSVLPPVCLSVCPHGASWIPLDGF